MTIAVFSLVLTAALMHALWNAMVKGAADRTLMLGLIALGHVVPGLAILSVTGIPVAATFPYIIASTVIHWGYYGCLNLAYRGGDLSVVYPIARGIAPVLIALGAQVWVGEVLPIAAWGAILAVSFGIGLLSFSGLRHSSWLSIGAAVLTGITIAAYSLADGVGVRVSGDPLAYIGLLFVAEIFVVIYIFATRLGRLRALPGRTIWLGFAGGMVSSTAYALVLYAKTLAPLGPISALRETSVVFAALIGILWFREGPRTIRVAAAIVVSLGIVLLSAAT